MPEKDAMRPFLLGVMTCLLLVVLSTPVLNQLELFCSASQVDKEGVNSDSTLVDKLAFYLVCYQLDSVTLQAVFDD